jgi:hypothetical protein
LPPGVYRSGEPILITPIHLLQFGSELSGTADPGTRIVAVIEHARAHGKKSGTAIGSPRLVFDRASGG